VAGLLVVLALIVAVVWVFMAQFRKRVQARLDRQGLDLPAELDAALRTRAAAGRAPAAHFMLIYEVWPDFLQQRAKYRDEHLALAWKAAGAGELLLAGALEDGSGQAFLLFRGSREAAQRFAQADPYVRHGLVKQWHVRQWHTVVGEGAAAPARPGQRG